MKFAVIAKILYNLQMRRPRLALLATLLLTGCWSQTSPTTSVAVRAASRALAPVLILQEHNSVQMWQIRPPVAMGLYASSFLALRSLPSLGAALRGIAAQHAIFPPSSIDDDRVFALLTELGGALEVDVPEYLNRNPDRASALEAYVTTLTGLVQAADTQRQALEDDITRRKEERKALQTRVRDMERTINTASKDGNYAIVGGMQEELATASADLARADAELDQQNDTLRIYEELLDIGAERLAAINQNREILIAGLAVVEVPGIDDLRLIINGRRSTRRGTTSNRNGYDPFEGL